MKVFDVNDHFGFAQFHHELSAYTQLQRLQGRCIPKVLAVGRLPHSGEPLLAVQLGDPLPEPITPELAAGIRRTLQQLHAAGAVHGDVRLQNMLMRPEQEGHVLLCDLERCIVRANGAAIESEQQELELLLQQ